jgi:hypothetical protein
MMVDRAHAHGPGVAAVHGGHTAAAAKELARGGAHWRSRAQYLAVAAWGARGGDGDPYPGWHEAVEGHRRPGNGEGRWWLGELGGGAFGVRRKGKGVEFELGMERLR